MRPLFLTLIIIAYSTQLFGQVKDSAYYERVDKRVSHTIDYFSSNVIDDIDILDTVAYVKRIYVYHIEKIRAITSDAKNRAPMYAYAVKLHNERMGNVLSQELLKKYKNSFSENISGFTFCPICTFRYASGQTHCGHCGEQIAKPD